MAESADDIVSDIRIVSFHVKRYLDLPWASSRMEGCANATEASIPDADREQVIDYIGNEIRSLHEGNAIRYRPSADDLASMRRDDNRGTPEAAGNYLECRSVP